MAARTRSRVTPTYIAKYRVGDWAAYDAALRARGDLTVWFDEAAITAWNALPSGRPGGQRRYSDLAIVTALTLRTVFGLALRQTEGFVGSLIRVLGLTLAPPDHSTLCRRNPAATEQKEFAALGALGALAVNGRRKDPTADSAASDRRPRLPAGSLPCTA